MVEQSAVNRSVVGSSPTFGAILEVVDFQLYPRETKVKNGHEPANNQVFHRFATIRVNSNLTRPQFANGKFQIVRKLKASKKHEIRKLEQAYRSCCKCLM